MRASAPRQNQTRQQASFSSGRPNAVARQIQRACSCAGGCTDCRASSAEPGAVREVLRSQGAPLDSETRSFFESRFGHDFSGVRVHTDARASESALALSASAYTVGSHVVFGAGQYAPRTERGRFTLAHELAHVVQQGARDDSPPARFSVQPADAPWEREADLVARQVTRGESSTPAGANEDRPRAAAEDNLKSNGTKPAPFSRARRWLSSLMRMPSGALQRQCQETNHPTSPKHALVQLWYKLMFFPTHRLQREFSIPGAAVGGGLGYADLVSTTNHEIWDIIGPSERGDDITTREGQVIPGRRQDASRYVNRANISCPVSPPWTLGMTLPAQSIPPRWPLLEVIPRGRGILQYHERDREPERVLSGIRWTRRALASRHGEVIPEPALDRMEGQTGASPEFMTGEPRAGQPARTRPASPPVLTGLDPELAAYRSAVEQTLRSPNLPAAESYLLLAPPDFYEENVRAPRRAAAEATVRGAYEVQGTRAAINPVMGAHAMAVSLLGLHAALTTAGVTAITLGPSTIMMLESGLAAALQGLRAAGPALAATARSILEAMLNPRFAAASAGAVIYIANFRAAQAAPGRGGESAAGAAGELESLRVVRFAPEGAVRITHRSQSAEQSGVHAFYEGEHYMVVGRARRQAGAAP